MIQFIFIFSDNIQFVYEELEIGEDFKPPFTITHSCSTYDSEQTDNLIINLVKIITFLIVFHFRINKKDQFK